MSYKVSRRSTIVDRVEVFGLQHAPPILTLYLNRGEDAVESKCYITKTVCIPTTRREVQGFFLPFPGGLVAAEWQSIYGVLPRSGFPQKIEKLLCRVFFPVSQSF